MTSKPINLDVSPLAVFIKLGFMTLGFMQRGLMKLGFMQRGVMTLGFMKRGLMKPGLLLVLLSPAVGTASLPDFTALVQKASPAVVNIRTTRESSETFRRIIPEQYRDVPEILRRIFPDRGRPAPSHGAGSGFIISSDGYILTNNHVVDGATEIIVSLSDRREPKAVVVGQDPLSDLALLKIDIADLPTMEIGRSENLQAGQWVVAIGSPFNFSSSVTAGIVSATGRSLPYSGSAGNYVPFIQTDVAINPGNSGGPLLDLEARVVGINSQIYTRSGGSIGLSFAIPIDVAMEVVSQLKADGRVSRGWLGVGIQGVNRNLAEAFGMHRAIGALITEVHAESPAAQSGLQRGDVIVAFNNKPIELSSDLPHLVGRTPVGSTSLIEIIREGKKQTLKVVIGELNEEDLARNTFNPARSANRLGVEVVDLSEADKSRLNLDAGVMVRHVYPGPFREAGIIKGDLLAMLHGKPVTGAEQFRQLASTLPGNRAISVRIVRAGQASYSAIKIIE